VQNDEDDDIEGGMALIAYLVLVVVAVAATLLVWGVVAVLR